MIGEGLDKFIEASWKCSHPDVRDGWCPRCGCACDDYTFTVGAGDTIISALDGYAFLYRGRIIWYSKALYKLGLLPSPTPVEEQWQPVVGKI